MFRFGIFLLALTAAFIVAAETPAQERLMKAEAEKLKEINRQVLETLGDLAKYDNQTIYVKAKLVPQGDDKFKVKIEQVSLKQPEFTVDKSDEKNIVIKGSVTHGTAKEFKLDLEYVLPPPADNAETNKK